MPPFLQWISQPCSPTVYCVLKVGPVRMAYLFSQIKTFEGLMQNTCRLWALGWVQAPGEICRHPPLRRQWVYLCGEQNVWQESHFVTVTMSSTPAPLPEHTRWPLFSASLQYHGAMWLNSVFWNWGGKWFVPHSTNSTKAAHNWCAFSTFCLSVCLSLSLIHQKINDSKIVAEKSSLIHESVFESKPCRELPSTNYDVIRNNLLKFQH